MVEYISREDAVIVADYALDEHPNDKTPGKPETFSEYNQGWHDACDYIRNKLEELSSAAVAPVRHGRWILKNKVYGDYECSVCHGMDSNCTGCYSDHYAAKQNFCPNCGAKMDGRETE